MATAFPRTLLAGSALASSTNDDPKLFNAFLRDTVNLNDTRLARLEGSVGAIQNFLEDSDWDAAIVRFEQQGSWAHQTIIKPVDGKPFDADLLVVVETAEGWEATEYLSTLRAVFAHSAQYKGKVDRSSHCVTITYADDRRIDVAPCVKDRLWPGSLEVCNFSTNSFELTKPAEYGEWLKDRGLWTRRRLKQVTRLLKYLRDIKKTFTCPSFLLTALLGMQVTAGDEFDADSFVDVPTSLVTLVRRLDDWLQRYEQRPDIRNPVLASEVISDALDHDQYKNFRATIHRYRGWIDEAFAESDRDERIGLWRRVFGEDFAKKEVTAKAASVSLAVRASAAFASPAAIDLVSLFAQVGPAALPKDFDRMPHKHRPTWRFDRHAQVKVEVRASLHASWQGNVVRVVRSGDGPLAKGNWLRFDARGPSGMSFGSQHEVHWRVTNTDAEAIAADALRGGFVRSNEPGIRWEHLGYRGVHMVEAFVLRKRDKALIGWSESFYVVIA